jgi:hypothetical protein
MQQATGISTRTRYHKYDKLVANSSSSSSSCRKSKLHECLASSRLNNNTLNIYTSSNINTIKTSTSGGSETNLAPFVATVLRERTVDEMKK